MRSVTACVATAGGVKESVTCSVKGKLPAEVGVPDINPVFRSRLNPGGSEPLEIETVRAPNPPKMFSCPSYDAPATPSEVPRTESPASPRDYHTAVRRMGHRYRYKNIRQKVLHDCRVGHICPNDDLPCFAGIQSHRGVGNGGIWKIRIAKTPCRCKDGIRNAHQDDILYLLFRSQPGQPAQGIVWSGSVAA